MAATETATLKEFAGILGCRPSYVTALKKAGRLVLTGDGRVVVAASQKLIDNTRSGQRQHTAAARSHAERRGNGGEPLEGHDDGPSPEYGSRAYWERREAAARAETREIELRKLKGELVETAAVAEAGTEAGTAVRTVLENLADQLAPILAAETDEPSIHRLLREHMDHALTDIIGRLETAIKALAEESGE